MQGNNKVTKLNTLKNSIGQIKKSTVHDQFKIWDKLNGRAGKSLIWLPSKSLVFLSKNEPMSDSLKKMSDALKKMSDSFILSFLVSDLRDSLRMAHLLWATWANHSCSLIFGERPEQFAHIPHLIWAKGAIHSHCSPKKRNWAKMSDSLIFQ